MQSFLSFECKELLYQILKNDDYMQISLQWNSSCCVKRQIFIPVIVNHKNCN